MNIPMGIFDTFVRKMSILGEHTQHWPLDLRDIAEIPQRPQIATSRPVYPLPAAGYSPTNLHWILPTVNFQPSPPGAFAVQSSISPR